MKKIIAGFFVLIFLVSGQFSASAANITLKGGKSATVIFPNSVTLKKSGCQNISVKYTIGKMPADAFAALIILDDSDAAIANSVFYKTPGFDAKIWKKSGTFNLKVCRNDWSEDFGDGNGTQNFLAVKKGTYQMYLGVYPGIEEYSTITFK